MRWMDVSEKFGSPGWSRTSDFLINRRGPAASRAQSFCMVPCNPALPRVFSLHPSGAEKDSRRSQGLKSACLTGAFSANQRKQPDP
jgi:hypothetical protein